jgi:hypothetical protein
MITDYMVSFSNGTGGNFLISLLERTVLGGLIDYNPLALGPYNDAHFNARYRNFKQEKIVPKNMGDMKEGFDSIIKIKPNEPSFIPMHLYWPSVQFARWPNARMVVILHTEADALDISISGFFKTEMSSSSWRSPDGRSYNTNMPPSGDLGFNQNNVIFEGIRRKTPDTLTPKELNLAVRSRVAMVLNAGFHLIEPTDSDPRINYIQYNDLMTNPDCVLATLERATQITPSEVVVRDLLAYQQKQREFLTEVKTHLGIPL